MRSRLPIAEAKARFAECIRRAERGETIVLTRHGRPVARLAGLARAGGEEAGPGAGGEVREGEAGYAAERPAPGTAESRREALERLLAEAVWPRVPPELRGKGIGKREREEILGYGRHGV